MSECSLKPGGNRLTDFESLVRNWRAWIFREMDRPGFPPKSAIADFVAVDVGVEYDPPDIEALLDRDREAEFFEGMVRTIPGQAQEAFRIRHLKQASTRKGAVMAECSVNTFMERVKSGESWIEGALYFMPIWKKLDKDRLNHL